MGWKTRWVHDSFRALGVAGALLLAEGNPAVAQTATLTVQPREMATGTKNPETGEYPLDSVTGAIVSVPPQCVGAKRCPLLVALPGGGQPASVMTGWLRPVADRYGFMLLAVSEGHYKPAEIDAALKEVLRRFAIDPEKIAVSGRCASGGAGMSYGIRNLHVFSRIASISGGVPITGMDPQNKTAEFLIDAGYQESAGKFAAVNELRQNGHPVRHTITLRGHEHQGEDYDFLGRWLHESWTKPLASRTAPSVVADPLPLLTTEAVTQMTAFWTSFFQEPDSIRTIARWAHIRDVVVPVGQERPVVPMVDMTAMAAKYPSIAAALKKAGLTAQQHDAYRAALVSAMVAKTATNVIGTLDEASPLAKNLAFVTGHPEELKALASAGIEDPGKFSGIGGCCTKPEQVAQMGPLGIWRTP